MYSPFPASATQFQMIRKGWFRGSFELTDGKAIYGELSYSGLFGRKASVKTASASWIFQHRIFSQTIFITDENGLTVGELRFKWLTSGVELHLENGSVFSFARPWFWKRQYFFWLDNQQEQVMSIKLYLFSGTMDIVLEKDLQSDTLPLLLIFSGTHLVTLRKRRRVAAAH